MLTIRAEAWPSPYSCGRSSGIAAAATACLDRIRIVVHEDIRAHLDRRHPLRGGAKRHAGDLVPVRLLLEAAGVGRDDAGLRRERGELEVAQRIGEMDVGVERDALLLELGARARMGREDDPFLQPVQPFHDVAEAWLEDVRLPVHRRHHVAPGLERYWEPLARDRREAVASLHHHVADHVGLTQHAFLGEGRARAVVRAEEEPGQAVDLDARPLLGHRQIAAAQTGLHVRERNRRLRRRARAGEGGVRVAVHEHEIGLLTTDDARDLRLHELRVRGLQVEAVLRSRQTELLDEHLGERTVVVLSRVYDDLLDPGDEECEGQRAALDELRPVSDDGEDLHERGAYWPAAAGLLTCGEREHQRS